MDVARLLEHVSAHPPRCIAALRSAPLPRSLPGMDQYPSLAYFRIGCPCGEGAAFVLGHWLRGGEHPGEKFFTGPLAVECPRCGRVTQFMDPERDGYDGELGANTNAVGAGEPSRFPCPHCRVATPMLVLPGFSYKDVDEWHAPEEQLQRPQDFFGAFWLYGACTRCQNVVSILGFECA
jgi:hypothetical protein